MADASYQPAVYRKQGGNGLVITTGGTLELWNTVQAGGVTWTITTTGTGTKQIVAQVTDGAGTAVSGNRLMKLYLFADAGPAAFLTPTSAMTMTTGSDAATCELIVGSSAAPQYSLYAISSTAGELSLKWSDTGKTATYIGAEVDGGYFNISTAAITTT